MHGYIYIVSDSGYEHACKIGFHKANPNGLWKCVPSYSPRPMRFDAAWMIPSHLMGGNGSDISKRRAIKQELHRRCGDLINTQPGKERAGRDWIATSPKAAETVITQFLGRAPCLRDGHLGQTVTNDIFRNPHPSRVSTNRHKIAVWLYREIGTDHLKTQYIDDWTTPREKARRYSVNGIEELAAYTYDGPTTPDGNKSVLDSWTAAVTKFGHGPNDRYYGWLKEGVSPNDLLDFYAGIGLTACRIGKCSPAPQGIKKAYNRPESV